MKTISLIYHSVDDGGPVERFRISKPLFERHLEAIAAAGANPTLVTEPPQGTTRLLLTFDDGDDTNATAAAPALARYGWPAHFFIITNRIGGRDAMDADAIRGLHAEGHLIGSHSHSHRVMTRLSPAELDEEWRRSKAVLEEILGEPVTSMSVPRGMYSAEVGRAAAAAGYRELFVSEPWLRPRPLDGSHVYGRFAVIADTTPAHVAALSRGSRGAIAREAALYHVRRHVKALLGPIYQRIRAQLLARRHR
jgi:peptidoglycan/xylan/chitin deacetylase (PgdA/CDA1 family)